MNQTFYPSALSFPLSWAQGQDSTCSVAQSYPTLCDPMDWSTPGFPVLHQLPEIAQSHVHQVSDAIQPSHSLLSPSLPASNLSSIRVFSKGLVLCIRWPKYWIFSFSISPSNEYSGQFPLGLNGWISLQSKGGRSRVFSNTTVQKHQFLSTQLSLKSNSHIHTWILEKTIALTRWTFVGKVKSEFL